MVTTTTRLCEPNKKTNNNKMFSNIYVSNDGNNSYTNCYILTKTTTTISTTKTTTTIITTTTSRRKRSKLAITNLLRIIDSRSLVHLIVMLSTLMAHMMVEANIATPISTTTSTTTRTTSIVQEKNTFINNEIEHDQHMGSVDSNEPHIRKKRLIWITDDGRLALPPGTSLTITPTLALPFIRHPPEGFFSNMSISFPLTIDFDKLGLTDNQNPLGDFPPLFARSFGHAAGEMVGNYVARYLHYKRKRDTYDRNNVPSSKSGYQIKHEPIIDHELPELPARFKHIFHGGERVMLYAVVEDFLSTFGMDGKACLLRAICEVHSRNLGHYGVFGEMAKLFLTVTRSPFADLIPEYVQAQETGEGRRAPGECYPYYKDCPKSIFKAIQNSNNKYSEEKNQEYHEADAEEVDAYRPLPIRDQSREKVDERNPSLNEIEENSESKFVHSFSM